MKFHKTGYRINHGKVYIGLPKTFKQKHKAIVGDQQDLVIDLPNLLKGIYVKHFQKIRIIPRYDEAFYQIEFVYILNPKKTKLVYSQFFASDLGLDNFATNVGTTGTTSIIYGMYIKSLNLWYNKENVRLQSIRDKQGIKQNINLGKTTNQNFV